LNWAGKAEKAEFNIPTLPLFIHERLSTQAILETLKKHKRDKQTTLSLFADEDLSITDRILKAYIHKSPWVNRMILGDSLVVMNSLLEYEGLGGQVQMIYMDPPYGVKFGSNFQPFVRKRDVKHSDDKSMTREPEMVQAYRDTWELGLHSYLTYLRDRFLLARKLLHRSGSIFVQIGDENVHHVREVLDEVFGAENFCSLITFTKTTGFASELLDSIADYILWYGKDKAQMKYRQIFQLKKWGIEGAKHYDFVELPNGIRRRVSPDEKADPTLLPAGVKFFSSDQLTSQGETSNTSVSIDYERRIFHCPSGLHWKTTPEGIKRLGEKRRLLVQGNMLRYARFLDDFPVSPVNNIWEEFQLGAKAYVVQTALGVIQRCILMTTDPGDLILDPTCGSGTTAYVAEQWGRRWITIDTSRVPLALARQRLLTATFLYYELRDPSKGPASGFVYKRKQNKKGEEVGGIVPHITLKSIAQNQPQQRRFW